MPQEKFRRELEKELTGKDSEPSELIYFGVYKSQIRVIKQTIETAVMGDNQNSRTERMLDARHTAALIQDSDKSRGYCLEMICADFLAGANVEEGNPEILLQSISLHYSFFLYRNKRPFCPRSGGKRHEEGARQGSSITPECQKLPRTAPPGSEARQLALPELR